MIHDSEQYRLVTLQIQKVDFLKRYSMHIGVYYVIDYNYKALKLFIRS